MSYLFKQRNKFCAILFHEKVAMNQFPEGSHCIAILFAKEVVKVIRHPLAQNVDHSLVARSKVLELLGSFIRSIGNCADFLQVVQNDCGPSKVRISQQEVVDVERVYNTREDSH
jgi:hypothetical protein